MDLDVLLPFHTLDQYFELALESLASATGVKLRLILINDSPERYVIKKNLLTKFSKVEILHTNGGEGYGEALKIGTTAVESNAVALFNSDDLIDSNRFAVQLRFLDQSELSITNVVRINSDGNRSKSLLGEISATYNPIFLILGSYGANASWTMRTDWWKKNSFFDRHECLDWRIALNSFSKSKISYTRQTNYYYRRHSNQKTARPNRDISSYNSLYDSWSSFSRNLGITEYTREIFHAFAIPWAIKSKIEFERSNLWQYEFAEKIQNLNKVERSDILQMLARRYFLLSLNSKNNNIDRFRYLTKALTEIPGISIDLFNS